MALVGFLCVERAHLVRAAGTLTIAEGRWAFCPSDHQGGHRWQALETPISIQTLRRTWRTHAPVDASAPAAAGPAPAAPPAAARRMR